VGPETCHGDYADRRSVTVDYFVDQRINLTALYCRHGHNPAAIRRDLIMLGFLFAEANQFALFAVYGFHGPTEKQTLNMTNKARLSVLDENDRPRRKDPPTWNRL